MHRLFLGGNVAASCPLIWWCGSAPVPFQLLLGDIVASSIVRTLLGEINLYLHHSLTVLANVFPTAARTAAEYYPDRKGVAREGGRGQCWARPAVTGARSPLGGLGEAAYRRGLQDRPHPPDGDRSPSDHTDGVGPKTPTNHASGARKVATRKWFASLLIVAWWPVRKICFL